MTDTDAIQTLLRLSHELGADPAFVQGGGGNCSVKPSGDLMLVKASGTLLADMTADKGFVRVDPAGIAAILGRSTDDNDYYRSLQAARLGDEDANPSMETGFHAVLGPVVAHTHSVYLNVLTCAKEGPALAQELFPDLGWIPYCSPGLALSRAIQAAPRRQGYLLQNHGVIVWGGGADEVIESHAALNERARRALALTHAFEVKPPGLSIQEIRAKVLFPDQVVFTSSGDELLQARAAKETLAAYGFILAGIHAAGLTPNLLQDEDAAALMRMDAEKNRQALAT